MLQQTQVATVIPYWERWMAALPDPGALAAAPEDAVLKLWEGLGYYSRARNLKRAAEIILREHRGVFPSEIEQVRALPGIGEYTAGAVCSIAFDQPEAAVDGNTARVLARVLAVEGDPRGGRAKETVWEAARAWMREAARQHGVKRPCAALTQALMELGAMVCAPRNPRCQVCPLRRCCEARRQGRVAEIPHLGARAKAVARRFVALVMRRGEKYLARRRPAGGVNAGLWEFPNWEVAPGEKGGVERVLSPFGGLRPKLMMSLKHSITRYRITLEVYAGEGEALAEAELVDGVWVGREAMRGLAFTGAHGKIAKRLAVEREG
jgi:A/G-specific adenine glycosylase